MNIVGQHLYKLFTDVPGCGCGDPEAAWRLTYRVVRYFWEKNRHLDQQIESTGMTDRVSAVLSLKNWTPLPGPNLSEILPDPGARQIILGALQDAELIDHGTSFYSSWLTDKGKWFIRAVEDQGGIEGLNDRLEFCGLPQHTGECTEYCWKLPIQHQTEQSEQRNQNHV